MALEIADGIGKAYRNGAQQHPGRGGGGGHSGTGGGGGGGGGAPALRILRKKGSFLRPPHVRDFVKEGYFFVPRYEVWGCSKTLTINEIYAALTDE